MAYRDTVRTRLLEGPPVVLDGPVGTELNRRGVDTGLPLWSARALMDAPEVVARIHADYVEAGADWITTNTFRTHARTLAREGCDDRAEELTRLAVELARSAVGELPLRVVGSVAPLEDCYSPELTPGDRALHAEHDALCGWLADAGVDLLLVETMPTVREALAASECAAATGLPFVVGLVCGRDGRLLSGEEPAAAARALESLEPAALAINCTPAANLSVALRRLEAATEGPLGAYGNVGHAEEEQGWVATDVLDPAAYARLAAEWVAIGARLVGSCCGTGPRHTRAIAEQVRGDTGSG